jgi:hypothetical protein
MQEIVRNILEWDQETIPAFRTNTGTGRENSGKMF